MKSIEKADAVVAAGYCCCSSCCLCFFFMHKRLLLLNCTLNISFYTIFPMTLHYTTRICCKYK